MERSGSTGNGAGSSTGSSTGNTGSSSWNTGSGTGSGSRNTGSSTGSGTRTGSRNIGNGTGNGTGNNTGNGTGNNTGNGTGNGSGSGRAAPPGGTGRALLCLALLLLPPARALPTAVRRPLAQCLSRSWDLLEATNTSLHRLKVCGERDGAGFNCTFEEVDMEDITENQINTIRACMAEDPGPGNCPVLERSTFDEGKCLQGISEDLRAYRPHLRNLEDPQLLVALDALMEVRNPVHWMSSVSKRNQEIFKIFTLLMPTFNISNFILSLLMQQ
uniref:Interleukin-12 subunit alpha n=1 Tax=Cyanoderma ruficeps TaxID=181631 RepID=A0A8C3QNL9_9PASS